MLLFIVPLLICAGIISWQVGKNASGLKAADAAEIAEVQARCMAPVRRVETSRSVTKKSAAQAEKDRRQAEKLQAARELAELKERALQAARELKALQEEKRPETISSAPDPSAPVAEKAAPQRLKTISGQVVSFTGRLVSMTRQEAIEKVQQAGGQAYYKEMPSFTTLLVVGIKPGKQKLDQFENQSGIRKVNESEFLEMLKGA